MNAWFYLALAIGCEVVATTSLKASDGFTKWFPSLGVVLGYGAAFYFLSLTLKTIPVGIAYAVWSGIGVALISLVSWWLYGQKLDGWGFLGIGLILSGVFVLNVLSKSTGQ